MKRTTFAVAAVLAMAGGAALAQEYPGKPIALVIGFPPGGGADGVARLMTEKMSKLLGQPVIMDYRPGAGTTIASTYVSRAAPDGYTIYMGSAGIYGADHVLYKGIKYEAKDFTPIARWTRSPMLLAVNTASGIKTTQDLLARAKSEPDKIRYASSGNGVAPHLAGRLFELQSGAKMMHVPFKGGAPAVQAVASGDVDITFGTPPSILPIAQTGRITPIAVTTAQRSPLFPDLPAISEAGLKDYDYSFWFGLYGPAGLPKEIVNKLSDASIKALNDPEIKTKLAQSGNEAFPSSSPTEFTQWAQAEGKRSKELMEKSGAKID